MIVLDGSRGEGGGQILRTALALSLVTGTPFTLHNIRAGRAKPGLLRQHAAAVEAARQVGGAEVDGGDVGSRELVFRPGGLRGGDYQFAVGSAGSATLVFQTVFPALMLADTPSTLTLEGGTHNPSAPPFDFLEHAFAPLMRRMGVGLELALERHGFYPAGGGRFTARIVPTARAALRPLSLTRGGKRLGGRVRILAAHLPGLVGEREEKTLRRRLAKAGVSLDIAVETVESPGPGNVMLWIEERENVTEILSSFGMRGLSSESVADVLFEDYSRFRRDWVRHRRAGGADDPGVWDALSVPVGPHLADQLLLPLALAGGGEFAASEITQHTRTNADVIQTFLPATFAFEDRPEGEGAVVRVGKEE